ncbi:choice-of-anchor Q domain-containing protein [Rhizobium sp.]
MATFVVTTADDVVDGGDGKLSLREAVALANADAGGDTIVFAAALGGQTITLTSEIEISEDLVIDGDIDGDNKADVTLSGGNATRLLAMTGATTDVALKSLTLVEGYSQTSGGTVLADNIGSLSIRDTTMAYGFSSGNGAAIATTGTDLRVVNSLFVYNQAIGDGGAIHVSGGSATFVNSTLYYNIADGYGGALAADDATVAFYNSTITTNLADAEGTEMLAGGGISVDASSLTTVNTVVSANFSGGEGGGYVYNDVRGTIASATNSVFGAVGGITANQGSAIDVFNPGLDALGDHGGTVETISLAIGSVLLDRGSSIALSADAMDADDDGDLAEALPTDGRGMDRISGGRVDVGAYEYQQGNSTALASAFNGLSLVDSEGNPVAAGSLLTDDGETVVLIIDAVNDEGGNLRLETQATIAQANQLRAAAYDAGHELDIKIICADGYAAPLPGLVDGVEVYSFVGDGSGDSLQQIQDLQSAYMEASGRLLWTLPYMAYHKKPGETTIDVVLSTSPNGAIGLSGLAAQVVYENGLEAALAATGPAVDLERLNVPASSGMPATGRFDAIGEFVPNLAVTDSFGQATTLYQPGDGVTIISVCATWCGPCKTFSSTGLADIRAALGNDIRVTELILQNDSQDTAHTADAAAWREMHGMTDPVVTFNGNVEGLVDFATGIDGIGFPTYIVVDNRTGEIVTRLSVSSSPQLINQLAAAAAQVYSELDPDNFRGTRKDDTFEGGLGFDRIRGADGDDKLSGDAGNDRLQGGAGRDHLYGGTGNDLLFGGDGNDRIYGEQGNDYIRSGLGRDFIDGGVGNDTLSYAYSKAGVRINLLEGTASGGSAEGDRFTSIENLQGSAFKDVLIGDDGDNIIEGGAGGDILQGGLGFDFLSYATSNAAVKVNLNSNIVSGGHAEGDRISGFEAVLGSMFGDKLSAAGATTGSFFLLAGGGNDIVIGGDGSDYISGGAGVDRLTGGGGADQFELAFRQKDRDVITDFGRYDYLIIDLAVFGSEFNYSEKTSRTPDIFDPTLFVANAEGRATGLEDRLVYNTTTGELFYDKNGSAEGGMRLILTLEGAPDLYPTQFILL